MPLVRNFALILLLLIHTDLHSQETKIYPCRTPCNIGIQIGDFKSADTITVAALLKAEGVKAEAGNFTILSYRITMDGPGFCELYEIYNSGEKFTEKTLSLLRRLRRGSFMAIECITAKDSCGNMVGLIAAFYIIR